MTHEVRITIPIQAGPCEGYAGGDSIGCLTIQCRQTLSRIACAATEAGVTLANGGTVERLRDVVCLLTERVEAAERAP